MKSLRTLWMLSLAILAFSSQASAWGNRGHSTICESAVFLVKEPGLKDYLKGKPAMMGHICNIPDFQWRSLPPEMTKLGNPTHMIDPEITGLKISEIPADFKQLVATYTGQPNQFKKGATIYNVPAEFGSMWWRADQFFRRFLSFEKDLKTAELPKNFKEETNNELPFNKAVYEMAVSLGLMGHFVGDASQPLHNTADYDGYGVGHGGLHAYYEEQVVSEFDGDLVARVLKEGRTLKNPRFLAPTTVIEKMRALSQISVAELPQIIKLDPIKKPSSVVNEKGLDLRKAAERESPAVGNKKLSKLIVTQMARASVLLAHLWDQAYVEAGRPPMVLSKIYKYPTTVDFVAPDYLPAEAVKSDVQ